MQSVYKSNCSLDVPTDNPACLRNNEAFTFEGGNGPTTGNCVEVADGSGQCEIQAWCQVEDEDDEIRY